MGLYVKKHGKSHGASVANFIEESIIRRELSDNFCFYNTKYGCTVVTCCPVFYFYNTKYRMLRDIKRETLFDVGGYTMYYFYMWFPGRKTLLKESDFSALQRAILAHFKIISCHTKHRK